MSSPANTQEFPDIQSHNNMWKSFTHLLVRAVIGMVVVILALGFITGVL